MRSSEQPVSGTRLQTMPFDAALIAGESARPVAGARTLEAAEIALRIRQVELNQQHRDLDDTIARLCEGAAADELLVARLKKRKLRIRDELARIERLLLPVPADRILPNAFARVQP
jgi:hypothetical protein